MLAPVLAAVLLTGAAATDAPQPAATASAAEAPIFEGRFRFAGGSKEREGVDAAIERSVQALLSMFHDLARKRLSRANSIPTAVTMQMHGDELEIVYGDLEPMRAPLDGSVRHWHNREGTRVKLTLELRGSTLVQTTWGGGGRRVMRWRLDQDGTRLRLHSTMSSPHLPVDVDYRLTFRS